MDKYDYIQAISMKLKGTSGIKFQEDIGIILKAYCKSLNKTYEMPRHYGGDEKNDGWIKEDALFYQIYSPTTPVKKSLKKDIQSKFTEDLEGLLEKIYKENKWNGEIKEFVYIVNMFDNNLPEDSEGFFEKKVNEFKKRYGIDFKYRVDNVDYIIEILEKVENIEILKKLSTQLQVKSLIDPSVCDEKIVYDSICLLSDNLSKKCLKIQKNIVDYKRISSDKKISINSLDIKRDEIENYMVHLDVVEGAISLINQDLFCENKFERVKNYVVDIYKKLSKQQFTGEVLYDKIFECTLETLENKLNFEVPIKLLIVYIFDKCDIFEKEEGGGLI